MKIRAGLLAVLAMLGLAGLSLAQPATAQELAGTWQGKLQVDPKTSMTIQFVFAKKPDGSYSAVLNSPDNPALKNMAADSVTLKGGALSVKVAALSGGFDGTLSNGAITGQWKQPGGTLPLVLSPFQKPVLSKAAIGTLTGTWSGPITAPGGATLTFVATFKVDATGDLTGVLVVPEQGGRPLELSDIALSDGKMIFKIAPIQGVYEGTVANNTVTGTWRQLGLPNAVPVVLKKGEYVAKVITLKLPNESFAKLSGTWKGDLHVTGPQGAVTLPIVLRFETNANANYVAFMDSPSQKVTGVPVTETTLTDGKVVVKIGQIGEYDATLAGNTMTGDWKQGPGSLPLVMTRK